MLAAMVVHFEVVPHFHSVLLGVNFSVLTFRCFFVRDVWPFILTCKVQYCSLYDQGYTWIGSIHDTVPNALLCINDSSNSKEKFNPAYMLSHGRLE
ncbi:hypothetical protein AB3S75_008982 [Citrus x aurantiifolia]